MLLCHINFGYPIVEKGTVLIQPETKVKARDEEAQKGIDTFNIFSDPVPDYKEQVFYHDMEPDKNGFVTACLFNKKLGENGLGAYVRFKKKQLPLMCEWKQVGEGEYVVGLEPGTAYPEGRAQAKKDGQIIFLKPGEKKDVQIEIGIVESINRLKI